MIRSTASLAILHHAFGRCPAFLSPLTVRVGASQIGLASRRASYQCVEGDIEVVGKAHEDRKTRIDYSTLFHFPHVGLDAAGDIAELAERKMRGLTIGAEAFSELAHCPSSLRSKHLRSSRLCARELNLLMLSS